MKSKINSFFKGMTLIELIICLCIVALVVNSIFMLFSFGNNIFKKGTDQFDVQSNIRIASDLTSSETRYTTQIEILGSSAVIPADASTLDADEGYIYYDSAKGNFVKLTKTSSQTLFIGKGTGSGIDFKRVDNDYTLYFGITGKDNSGNYNVESKVLCLNLQLNGINITGLSDGCAIHYKKTLTSIPTSTPTATSTPSSTPSASPTATPTPTIITGKPVLNIYSNDIIAKTVYLTNNINDQISTTDSVTGTSYDNNKCGTVKIQNPDIKTITVDVQNVVNGFDLYFTVKYDSAASVQYHVTYNNNGGWNVTPSYN